MLVGGGEENDDGVGDDGVGDDGGGRDQPLEQQQVTADQELDQQQQEQEQQVPADQPLDEQQVVQPVVAQGDEIGSQLQSVQEVNTSQTMMRDSRGVCITNGEERTVTVDLQSAFPDQFIVTCTEEDDVSIMDRLENALNAAFPYVASSWDGKATFEEFDFDFHQEVTNVDGFRRHRDLRILQTQICPARTTECPSSFDSCRLSCGLLSTTNCNEMDMASIEQLDNYLSAAVTASLRSLQLKCLGFSSELVALVRVINNSS
jgi:hypothetical protein